MNKRRKHGFRTGVFLLWLFIILLILSAITAGICIFLAFQDDYKNKYSFYQSDDSLMYTALKGAVFGEDFRLTETQVNTYINNEIIEKSGNDSIKNLRVYFENGIAEVYAKVNYMNNDFGLYAKAQISLDTVSKKFSIHLYNAKLGRLPIPDFILKDTLEKNISQTDITSVKDGVIYINSSYDFNIDTFTLNLTFQKFAIGDKIVMCRTNNLAQDALDTLKKALQTSEGREKLKNLFHFSFSENSLIDLGLDKIKDVIPDLRDLEDIKDKIIDKFSDIFQ